MSAPQQPRMKIAINIPGLPKELRRVYTFPIFATIELCNWDNDKEPRFTSEPMGPSTAEPTSEPMGRSTSAATASGPLLAPETPEKQKMAHVDVSLPPAAKKMRVEPSDGDMPFTPLLDDEVLERFFKSKNVDIFSHDAVMGVNVGPKSKTPSDQAPAEVIDTDGEEEEANRDEVKEDYSPLIVPTPTQASSSLTQISPQAKEPAAFGPGCDGEEAANRDEDGFNDAPWSSSTSAPPDAAPTVLLDDEFESQVDKQPYWR